MTECSKENHMEEVETSVKIEKSAVDEIPSSKGLQRLHFLLERAKLYANFLSEKLNNDEDTNKEKPEGKRRSKRKRTREEPETPNADLEILTSQPALVTGGTLREYQLEGVKWLISLYENGLNGILADEMGLGKTLQTIAFLAFLWEKGIQGPFLICAPLSVLDNWKNEIVRFTPSIPVLLYHGNKDERSVLRINNFKLVPFPIIVTSYEIAMQDFAHLNKIGCWKYIVVDEGHRLKNHQGKLLKKLQSLQSDNRLLLTGTPLQNNLTELWSLLHFLLPDVFDDLQSFQKWFDFSDLHEKSGVERVLSMEERDSLVTKLHTILDPFMLRRMKDDVSSDLSLPPKQEFLITIQLTDRQKQLYRAALDGKLRDVLPLQSSSSKNNGSLLNTCMQLRKICNHPYLLGPDDDNNSSSRNSLIMDSGKMQVLDTLIRTLTAKEHNRRILIFSQMTRMLDLIQDYLEESRVVSKFCRIDGASDIDERKKELDRFTKDENVSVFLLSTRAGGLGLNLVSADTVILYDSDWNPQMDLQAMARIHRIGQDKPVLILRLCSGPNTIETRMLEMAVGKRRLENLVVSKKTAEVEAEKTVVSDSPTIESCSASFEPTEALSKIPQKVLKSLLLTDLSEAEVVDSVDKNTEHNPKNLKERIEAEILGRSAKVKIQIPDVSIGVCFTPIK